VGCIGVILGLDSPESLIEANVKDCGSEKREDGTRYVANPRDVITIQDLEETINCREAYNEWVIKNFQVLGVLALEPYVIKIQRELNDPTATDGKNVTNDCDQLEIGKILKEFSGEKVYTFNGGKICKVENSATPSFIPINHSQIYLIDY
jgi:hypothetical protein